MLTEQTLSIGYVALAAERARSTAVGLYVTCYYVGGSLGGIAPAGIWSHLGWPGCVALILPVQAAAVVVSPGWSGRAPRLYVSAGITQFAACHCCIASQARNSIAWTSPRRRNSRNSPSASRSRARRTRCCCAARAATPTTSTCRASSTPSSCAAATPMACCAASMRAEAKAMPGVRAVLTAADLEAGGIKPMQATSGKRVDGSPTPRPRQMALAQRQGALRRRPGRLRRRRDGQAGQGRGRGGRARHRPAAGGDHRQRRGRTRRAAAP